MIPAYFICLTLNNKKSFVRRCRWPPSLKPRGLSISLDFILPTCSGYVAMKMGNQGLLLVIIFILLEILGPVNSKDFSSSAPCISHMMAFGHPTHSETLLSTFISTLHELQVPPRVLSDLIVHPLEGRFVELESKHYALVEILKIIQGHLKSLGPEVRQSLTHRFAQMMRDYTEKYRNQIDRAQSQTRQVATPTHNQSWKMDSEILSIALHPNGELVALSLANLDIVLLDVRTSHIVQKFKAHTSPAHALIFDYSGERLISGAYDNFVRIWDLKEVADLKPIREFKMIGAVQSLALSSTQEFLIAGDRAGYLLAWNLFDASPNPVQTYDLNLCIHAIDTAPQSDMCAVASRGGDTTLYKISAHGLSLIGSCQTANNSITWRPNQAMTVTLTRDASFVAVLDSEGNLEVHQITKTEYPPVKLSSFTSINTRSSTGLIQFHPQLKALIFEQAKGELQMLSLTSREVHPLIPIPSGTQWLSFHPEGRSVFLHHKAQLHHRHLKLDLSR